MSEKVISEKDLCEKIDFNLPLKDRFSKLAEYLFTQCLLYVKGAYFTLQEIEFYYDGKNLEESDDFCIHKEGRYNGEVADPFCLHQWGMDLMAGNKEIKVGVLIRGIESVQRADFTYGTSRLFTRILPQKEQYVQSKHAHQLKEMVNRGELKLIAKKKDSKEVCLLQGPRILKGKGSDESRFAPLRYAIDLRGADKGVLLLSSLLLGRLNKYTQMPETLKNYQKWWNVCKNIPPQNK